MVRQAYVRVNGELIECRITPRDLERGYRRKDKVFRTNGRRLLGRLSHIYGLTYRVGFSRTQLLNYRKRCVVRIEGLIDLVVGLGQSNRDALRNAVFRVHKEYCKLIEYKDE